ncbi:MAG: TonB-dependent receptor plug domain-containing protein [Prevotellaceae bacterium]|jgi:TonB-dependent SusC/RagA subfamily outer membrane receptor|nr:TonB-dependent receptor plug domain-containing protein [Prevotellaceae bacterium]
MKANIRFIVLLVGTVLTAGILNAQTIKGKVISTNNDPLVGAVVTLGDAATETNDKGEFAIKTAKANNNTIKVSLLGYNSQEIAVEDVSAAQTVQLAKSTENLDDVVVIGYGKSTKKKSTGTVSTITRETLEQYPGTSLLEVLQGRVAGLSISKTSGLPGSNASINIRGVNTISDGGGGHGCCGGGAPTSTNVEPLIVVDGVPFINQSISPLDIGAVGAIGPLASLSTTDIERIDVLKDSDATAIYGSRGANGVILITTKSSLE